MSAKDDKIAAYIKGRYNVLIGEIRAKEIRLAIGPNAGVTEETTTKVKGRCLESTSSKMITLKSKEICALID